jgi:hypothetical protein
VPFNTKHPDGPDERVLQAVHAALPVLTTPPSGNGQRSDAELTAVSRNGHRAIGSLGARERVEVSGRVHALRMSPIAGTPALECTLVDETGAITVVFFGRRSIPGVKVGARMVARGMVGEHHGRLALVNPEYEFDA